MKPTRDHTLQTLRAHRPHLEALGIRTLALFGSVARDEATPSSDIDLLVEFDHPVSLFNLQAVQDDLANLLGPPVDLVPRQSLKRQLRAPILAEAITITPPPEPTPEPPAQRLSTAAAIRAMTPTGPQTDSTTLIRADRDR